MYQVHFSDVTFAQSSKYVMIVKNKQQTKRSQICTLWTSVPIFNQPVFVQSLEDLTIKACSATIDRKLTVIGSFNIQGGELDRQQNILFWGQKNIVQSIQEKYICVGNCKIKIIRRQNIDNSRKGQSHQIDDDYELKSQSEQQSSNDQQRPECILRFIIHGGFDFYLGAGFKVCINWGSNKAETKMVSNRITPFWGRNISLKGRQDKLLEMSVIDNKGSKLQWLKLDPKQIRIMYPYHLHIKFREEYVGLHPHFYISVIRQDVPLFSILDKKINLKIKYIGPAAPQRVQQYLLICSREIEVTETNSLPQFIDLDMKSYISFENINSLIEKNGDKKYEWSNWNLLIPINVYPEENTKDYISLLKSFLSKSLVCVYFSLDQVKSFFCSQLWNNVTVLDRKIYFENSVKQLYYKQKRIVMGKSVQISNFDTDGLQNEKGAVSLEQRWKILTHNYTLRKQMLSKSIDTTQQIKKQIDEKGEYLEKLKKVLIEVKKMNEIMIQKQKSSLLESTKASKKIRENYNKFSTIEIVTLLLEKQIQLQKRKKINDEMRMRMDSLHYFHEDSEQLDKTVVQNAQKLLQQQSKIKQLKKMRQILPKQREVILKMQKIFERREMDRSMNELLKRKEERLWQMRRGGNKNLERVYAIVKDHKNAPHSILQSIKAAESQLIALNAKFAKLTTS